MYSTEKETQKKKNSFRIPGELKKQHIQPYIIHKQTNLCSSYAENLPSFLELTLQPHEPVQI